MDILITGVAGFIGSHLADYLIEKGHHIYGLDNLLTGSTENINPKVNFIKGDIFDSNFVNKYMAIGIDCAFHLAAIARTPWTIDDPQLCHDTNVTGTFNVLMAARQAKVPRVVLASSNVVYAANTPYRASKLMLEHYSEVFNDLYGVSTMALRFSNVYGSLRQSEQGPSINCIASLRKSKRENGYIWLTGDGDQTRDFTHVLDICQACELAALSREPGIVDVCSGVNRSMNSIAKHFDCPIKYVDERVGDVKHIVQDNERAWKVLGWKSTIPFEDGIKVYL